MKLNSVYFHEDLLWLCLSTYITVPVSISCKVYELMFQILSEYMLLIHENNDQIM